MNGVGGGEWVASEGSMGGWPLVRLRVCRAVAVTLLMFAASSHESLESLPSASSLRSPVSSRPPPGARGPGSGSVAAGWPPGGAHIGSCRKDEVWEAAWGLLAAAQQACLGRAGREARADSCPGELAVCARTRQSASWSRCCAGYGGSPRPTPLETG